MNDIKFDTTDPIMLRQPPKKGVESTKSADQPPKKARQRGYDVKKLAQALEERKKTGELDENRKKVERERRAHAALYDKNAHTLFETQLQARWTQLRALKLEEAALLDDMERLFGELAKCVKYKHMPTVLVALQNTIDLDDDIPFPTFADVRDVEVLLAWEADGEPALTAYQKRLLTEHRARGGQGPAPKPAAVQTDWVDGSVPWDAEPTALPADNDFSDIL